MIRAVVLLLPLISNTLGYAQVQTLSRADSVAIDALYESWNLAPPDSVHPAVLTAEFNGDGQTDKLVALAHPEYSWKEAEPWRRYVAIFGGGDGRIAEIADARADCISIQKSDSTGGFPETDAIRVARGAQGSGTHIWYGDRFVTAWGRESSREVEVRTINDQDSVAIGGAYSDWSLYPARDCITVYFTGDFNGDGWTDKVVALGDPEHHTGESYTEVVIVFGGELKWAYPFGEHILECIGLVPKGRRQNVVHTDISWEYETDGIYSCYPEKAGSEYIWYGGAFLEIGTGD